ncbi:hypothetical protein EHD45_20625 [Escherichia coli]|nr:hypothetical protein [Escherichia coli]
MGSCAAPSAKGDDKFITTDYLQQCPQTCGSLRRVPDYSEEVTFRGKLWPAGCNCGYATESCAPSHDAPLHVLPPHDWQ